MMSNISQKTNNQSVKSSGLSEKKKVIVITSDPMEEMLFIEFFKTTNIEAVTFRNGKEGLAFLTKTNVTAVICEHHPFGMEGKQILAKVKEISPDTSRVLITGNRSSDVLQEVFDHGSITHLLTKPWNDAILNQTILSATENYHLRYENRQLQKQLLKQQVKVAKNSDVLQSEVKLSTKIHETMLNGKAPTDIPQLECYALSIPSREIDGDFFDFYKPSDEHLDLVIGDVMGKGMPAALIGIAVKNQIQRFAIPRNRTQVIEKGNVWREDLYSPEEILNNVHDEMNERLIHLEHFSTLFFGRFNFKLSQFTFVDCGSPRPLYFQKDGQKPLELQGFNSPLGSFKTTEYQSTTISYEPGDLFVFYSDGITEAADPKGNRFGKERLIQQIKSSCKEPLSSIALLLKEEISIFTKQIKLQDDFTLILIRIKKSQKQKNGNRRVAKFTCNLSQLQAVRDFIYRFCQNTPHPSKELSEQMQLAINEIFCNIVKHSNHQTIGNEIIIEANYDEAGISFKISDQGEPFDPRDIEEPSLSGDRDQGFGWYILQRVVDQVSYTHKNNSRGRNHLRIFKSFKIKDDSMEILHRTEDEVLIITPKFKALDAKDVAIFKETIMDIISSKNPIFTHNVVLDLSALDFVDSSGLGSFLSTLRHLRDKGGSLKLCNLKPPVRTIFELVSMHKVFEIYEQLEQAVHSYAQGV